MNLKNTIFIAIIILFLFQLMVMKQDAKLEADNQKPTVITSTFSLYDIAKNLAGDSANIVQILPAGVDAHSYEPSPKQVANFYDSALVILSGAGLEPWVDGFDFKGEVLDMSLHVELKKANEHHHAEESEHAHEAVDPHYWLDIKNMIVATEYISYELIKMFPKNKEFYINNKNKYINMLRKLDKDYKEKLFTCSLNTIVVNHNAFSYLSQSYDFEVEAISGLSPEAQPDAKTMISLIEYVKEHKLKTIFFESFASDKAIKSIANEAKVSVDVLFTLGNITADQEKQNLSYEDIMRQNLEKLSKALECQ